MSLGEKNWCNELYLLYDRSKKEMIICICLKVMQGMLKGYYPRHEGYEMQTENSIEKGIVMLGR